MAGWVAENSFPLSDANRDGKYGIEEIISSRFLAVSSAVKVFCALTQFLRLKISTTTSKGFRIFNI